MYQTTPSSTEERKASNQLYAAMGILRRVQNADLHRMPPEQLSYLIALCESIRVGAQGVLDYRWAQENDRMLKLMEEQRAKKIPA